MNQLLYTFIAYFVYIKTFNNVSLTEFYLNLECLYYSTLEYWISEELK